MNHEILIETEVDGAEPYAGLLNDSAPYHSLRLRRRECARPPLLEKIIIKPLKKVEDHLWKLENPE